MTEYREAEGYLAPELDNPITAPEQHAAAPEQVQPKAKAVVITIDQIAQALKPVEHRLHSSARIGGMVINPDPQAVARGKKKPVKIEDIDHAVTLIDAWLQIAQTSIPDSREVKVLSAKSKALKQLKADELARA